MSKHRKPSTARRIARAVLAACRWHSRPVSAPYAIVTRDGVIARIACPQTAARAAQLASRAGDRTRVIRITQDGRTLSVWRNGVSLPYAR